MYAALKRLEMGLGRDVSQTQLAELVADRLHGKPRDQSTVGRWFRGAMPDAVTIQAIADVCGVEPGWLAFGRGPMLPPPATEHDDDEAPVVRGAAQLPGMRVPGDGSQHQGQRKRGA